jgi:hypothetical protein
VTGKSQLAPRENMLTAIGTREELVSALEGGEHASEGTRTLVVFRIAGFEDFTHRFGETAIDTMTRYIDLHLPYGTNDSTFYYRPRKDELCALIDGPVIAVEQALASAVLEANGYLGPYGITIGYATTLVPHVTNGFIATLAAGDRNIVDPAGDPMPRTRRPAERAGTPTTAPGS